MPHSHPDAATILAAALDYLDDELYPKLQGVDRYRSRVAINALRIVQREFSLGAGFEAADNEQLGRLLGEAPAAGSAQQTLADDIRQGRRGLDDPALVGFLTDSLRRALLINNPKWVAQA